MNAPVRTREPQPQFVLTLGNAVGQLGAGMRKTKNDGTASARDFKEAHSSPPKIRI